jgi:hypothetical protein
MHAHTMTVPELARDTLERLSSDDLASVREAEYALFCAQMLGLHTLSDKLWARLEAGLEPDLFAAPGAAAATETPTVQMPALPLVVAPFAPTVRPQPFARPLSNLGIASDSWRNRL